ncbi:Hpt domain-containing protein [Dechloromonas sp. A34]|uniref:Hpt domain-containing protein n=1 Tax=Dechloromonas sp. A34 TaxID=447588 RepID=UPI00224990A1|nr:Hpt domain-containing protein [Dechloromonas sp. A34]
MDRKDKVQAGGTSCNLDYLLINLGRNEEAAKRLVHLFLDNYPNLIGRLDESLANRDIPTLQRVVHDIRGSCVLFSARDCLDQTHRIENMLRDALVLKEEGGKGIDWENELVALRESLARMVNELKHYLGDGTASA